jgi:hypothetical protein
MSTTLARKIRRITVQKMWESAPDSMAVELRPVYLTAQQYADQERIIRADWKARRLARRRRAA